MPPATKKDCSVILFDLATRNREKAVQTFLKICCLNHLSNTADLTKLILLNSNTTENRLNAHYGGYEHIYEVSEGATIYDPHLQLNAIEDSGTGKASWLEGLLVAVKNLNEEFKSIGGIVTLQLLFITDLSSPLPNCDDSIIDEIVENINNIGAFLYIIGPDINVPFTIKGADDIKTWMSNLEVDENNENLKIAKRLVTNTKHSVICDYKIGVHLFFSFRNWGGAQPWQVPLSIGTEVQIPAHTMKILDEGMPCKFMSDNRFSEPVWVDAEDESKEISKETVRGGIMRHGKLVIIEDNKMFNVDSPRGFHVLCFTSSKNVPEYLMCADGCYCVLPYGTEKQNEAMNVLIDCLAQQNKYIIARRVYSTNFVPKIVALVPKPDHNPKCFYLASLPFAEEMRCNYNEKKVEAAPKIKVVDEVYNFLDTVNIEEDNCKKKVPLDVTMMVDCNSQKLVNKCCDKLLDKYMSLDQVDLDNEAASGEEVNDLKNKWVERKVVAAEDKNTDSDDSDKFDW